jgi:molybdopterin-binding protein
MRRSEMFSPREAARMLGISYPTIKQWIYKGRVRTVKTPGGHHRVPAAEVDRLVPPEKESRSVRRGFHRLSGRNQLVGRVVEVQISGLLAQVRLSVAGQHITSIITAEAAREMGLARGQKAAALIKSTEVMIVRV